VYLGFFGMDEKTSCVWKFDEIESSSGYIFSRLTVGQGVIVYEVFDLGG
jgi:hypothetical protein